ncbi:MULTISPECIES: FecR family protein [Limnospira]|uniref:FecR domain-containing protein n=1 Tax=Limnospira fusiformis PMC 851.14 TaxID=2219512 RepID=A0ABU9EQW7_LIMFS|nr:MULTISPECIES: FecR domain-containing protein [unclassified Limnospira]MDT9188337.1 FecR domain-containing protein [Limnospira sp. PMC 894.15]MDT9234094.1 FecR domain-containing protein [Limnospira sp. PMC 917.15]MDT9275165.1 FecR domain-containing protein [Limnospira sp. PMC 737.11]UWU50429.1 FecR family protein [Arthrospira platensis C1]
MVTTGTSWLKPNGDNFFKYAFFLIPGMTAIAITMMELGIFGAIKPAIANTSPLSQVDRTATRSLMVEELQGRVTINGRPAQFGDRLGVGDVITTGRRAIAILRVDSNIGVLELAENTTLEIRSLSGQPGLDPNQETVVFISKGRVRSSIARFVSAPFRNSTASHPPQEIAALNWEGIFSQDSQNSEESVETSPFRVETPVTVAGVRGTSFGVDVGPDGKTGISTVEGIVGASAEGQETQINREKSSVVNPNLPPTAPDLTPPLSDLQVFQVTRLSPRRARIVGQVDPMDIVDIDNRAIVTDSEGKFDLIANLPPSRRFRIVVRGPAVREREYSVPVP